MHTIKDVIQLSARYFADRGIENPRRQAEELLTYVLDLKRIQLYMDIDRPLQEKELEQCRLFLRRRGQGEPFAYIAGYVDFFGCKIQVDRNVLIPRQETEILLDLICKEINKADLEGKQVWDLCCGSGCLGIGLKKKLPLLNVTLSDLSPEALEVAKRNASQNAVEVEIVQGDLLIPFEGRKADFVICNPPYISEEEYAALDIEVRNYEPKQALVANADGLEFYKRLSEQLPHYLNPGGKAWFEIGWKQGEAVQKLFEGAPWQGCELRQDWSGKDRFFTANASTKNKIAG